jgi:antitoxin CptB
MDDTETRRDIRRRRLLFRATHRGSHENDILVGRFVSERLSELTDDEMDALEAVLEIPDVELADWLTGRRPIPAAQDSPVLRAMREAAGR